MKKFLVMQTDFSYKSGAVAVMHGVSYQLDPELVIDDVSHEVQKWSPYAASQNLAYVLPYWPKGTVFVSVVDPGVGTERKACIAKTKNGYYISTPDNGTLTQVVEEFGIEAIRQIDESINRYPGTEGINIFHGRDLFAYCGAKLASGIISFEEVGPEYDVSEIVKIKTEPASYNGREIKGFIASTNANFGINVTNIPVSLLEEAGITIGTKIRLSVMHNYKCYFNAEVLYHKSFGYVLPGEPVAYNAEGMMMGFALNLDNFMEKYKTEAGPDWIVTVSKAK